MTVCIAAICDQGESVVVASDTMVTNPGLSIEFEHNASKISQLSRTCVAMTAGDALAYTELFDEVGDGLSPLRSPSVRQIVELIKECYCEVRQKDIRERILRPRGIDDIDHFHKMQPHLHPEFLFGVQGYIDQSDYGLEIIVTGGGQDSHIFGVINPGTSQCFDAIGFHAIGSGSPHALNSLIARGCCSEKSIYEALIIVYEAKKLAEKAPGVGLVTDMGVLTQERVIPVPRGEIDLFEPIYQKWLRHDESWQGDILGRYKAWIEDKGDQQ